MVIRMDEIMVLLPSAVLMELRRWQECACPANVDERIGLCHRAIEFWDNDPNDATFIWATTTIGGRDAVKEFVACKMYLLVAGFGFESVPLGMTPVLKVETPLPLFTVGNVAVEYAARVLAEVAMEAEKVLGSFWPKQYDALCMLNIPNAGHLNRVLEQMGVPYAPRPLLGSDASQGAIKKQKRRCQRDRP
jgi:hypothetical protein